MECIGRDSSYDLSSDSLDGDSVDENGQPYAYEKLGSTKVGFGRCTYYKGLKEKEKCVFNFECAEGLVCGQRLFGDAETCRLFGDFSCMKPENQIPQERIDQIMQEFNQSCPAK